MVQWLRALAAFARGPGFDFQDPSENSQVFVKPVPGDLMNSSGLHWHQAPKYTVNTCRQNSHTHKQKTQPKVTCCTSKAQQVVMKDGGLTNPPTIIKYYP